MYQDLLNVAMPWHLPWCCSTILLHPSLYLVPTPRCTANNDCNNNNDNNDDDNNDNNILWW